ncbi:MAG: hypothetical protein ACHP7O_12685 [Burkholderiales bacterium]
MQNVDTIIAGTVATATMLASILYLGWWMRDQFSKLGHNMFKEMEKSRELNQERHDQNLRAFEQIRIALARAGLWHGAGK